VTGDDRVITNPVGFKAELLGSLCHKRRIGFAVRSQMHQSYLHCREAPVFHLQSGYRWQRIELGHS
jgi:hypothetical protein